MWNRLWHNYKLVLFDSFIVHSIFFHKLKICDKICGACIFDHILNKCGRFCVGFVIRTKGFLFAVSSSAPSFGPEKAIVPYKIDGRYAQRNRGII